MIDSMGTTGYGSASATVTGFFDSRTEAETAADRLRALGLGGQVRVTEGAAGSEAVSDTDDGRGFWEKLGDFFFPDDDRSTYAEGLSRGGYLVTASGLTADQCEVAMDTLEEAGAVDIDERAESWRAEGWSGGTTSAGGLAGSAMAGGYAAGGASSGSMMGSTGTGPGQESYTASAGGSDRMGGEESLPVVEERLRVGKRDVSHGRVRIRSYVVEEPVSETVRLEEDRVHIERRPVDRPATAGDDLFRERSLEAEEHREEAVVQKEARVVEEVALRRSHDSHEETVSDTVRRTEVEVEDARAAGSARSGSGMTEYEAETGLPDDEDENRLRNRP